MNALKIATWNVNSLRVRLPHVLAWIKDHQPDVLALQETKIPDADFPMDAIHKANYVAIFSGQKAYNGVAFLSRKKIRDVITDIPNLTDTQRRILGVTVGETRILNLYIPNGQSIHSEKYQYKLNWLKTMNAFIKDELKKYSKLIILGDFNIAPEENDVHDPAFWAGQVLFSEPERKAFSDVLQLGFHDCFRKFTPAEKNYTWWDYRLNAFKRNMGLRIDHILASSDISSQCMKCYIDKTPRSWERPSDHAPVIAEFVANT